MGLFSKKSASLTERNPEYLIHNFIVKSEGLQRILEKETEYFRDMKMKQAEKLIESKLLLIEEIEGLKTAMTSTPTILKNIPESEKQRIRSSNENLMKAAEENYNETLKAKEVNKLILEAISDALTQSKRIEGAYGNKGDVYRNSDNTDPVAIVHNA